jgi:ElaB/YqjD/DUF883 family membrane-anchored ribosome-binding protein
MSSIPSSAMPHAKASETDESNQAQQEQQEQGGGGESLSKRAGKLAGQAGEYARENPKTAIAAGAALAAGVIAAAIPLVRGRSGSGSEKKAAGAKKTTASKSTASKSTASKTTASKTTASGTGGAKTGRAKKSS